jgi:predicted ArsR family transcriptional regulator
MKSASGRRAVRTWSFITNHADVLLHIARDPTIRLRDLAAQVDITERAAQSIVNDLVAEGYLSRVRVGNRNHYQVHPHRHLRRAIVRHREVSALLDLLRDAPAAGNGRDAALTRPRTPPGRRAPAARERAATP